MFNLFDYFILTPLRLFFQGMYEVILIFISNYGVGIIGLSCVTALILIPIEKAVRGSILKEKKIESVLQPQLAEIKHKYIGIEKNNAIKRLYSRYGYSPLYSIRNVYGVLVQLPFLIGAYSMLSSYNQLNGQSFLFIKDLSLQDHLLGQVNLLPILMTVANLSTLLFLNLSKKENIQTGVIAFGFLILLYTAPSALLLYWTMNNIIHLLRAVWKRYICFDVYKKSVTEKVKLLVKKISKTAIGNYLKTQLIDKTETEFYKKNWLVFLFLSVTSSLFIIGFTNLGLYTPEDISRSLIFVSLLLLILFSFLYIIKIIGNNIILFKLLFIYVVLFFGACLYYKTSGYLIVESLPKIFRIIIIMSAFIIFYLIGGIKIVNYVLFLNVLGAVIIGVYNNYDSQQKFLSNIGNFNAQEIVLCEKPNFYYFLCESMNSLDIAQKTYGIDKSTADDFVDFLKVNGFYVPDYVYSNASHTLKTLQNIYLMNDFVAGNKGNADGSTSVRPMIAGSGNNKLLRLLKNNGFYTSSYYANKYFSAQKGPYMDYYDLDSLSNTSMILAEYYPVKYIRDFIYKLDGLLLRHKLNSFDKSSYTIIDSYLKNEPKKPHFMIHRVAYTNHTDEIEGFTLEGRDAFKIKYKKMYEEQIIALKYLVSNIVKKDPNSVIILCGDHGAHLYRTNAKSPADLRNELELLNISYEEYINDNFKVFAAVRIPTKYKQIDDTFSPGNIFSKIFNIIGYDGDKLNECKNDSYFEMYVQEDVPVIKNGEIVPLEYLSNTQ